MRQELEDLASKARESLDAAELLFERKFYDFATSRAYYAMFYLAEAALFTKGLSFSKHSAGKRLRESWMGNRDRNQACMRKRKRSLHGRGQSEGSLGRAAPALRRCLSWVGVVEAVRVGAVLSDAHSPRKRRDSLVGDGGGDGR